MGASDDKNRGQTAGGAELEGESLRRVEWGDRSTGRAAADSGGTEARFRLVVAGGGRFGGADQILTDCALSSEPSWLANGQNPGSR